MARDKIQDGRLWDNIVGGNHRRREWDAREFVRGDRGNVRGNVKINGR